MGTRSVPRIRPLFRQTWAGAGYPGVPSVRVSPPMGLTGIPCHGEIIDVVFSTLHSRSRATSRRNRCVAGARDRGRGWCSTSACVAHAPSAMRDHQGPRVVADDQRDGQLGSAETTPAPSVPREGLLRLRRPSPLRVGRADRVPTDRPTDARATEGRVPGGLCLPSGTDHMVSGPIQRRRGQAVGTADVRWHVFAGGP